MENRVVQIRDQTKKEKRFFGLKFLFVNYVLMDSLFDCFIRSKNTLGYQFENVSGWVLHDHIIGLELTA